ncbi:U1 protein [Faba bean necrotic yellows virus]|uniref:U1 protein n=1 Tax=Faba bean necrotic yellows virus TaxID=59817 RepID=V9TNF1_9VIRU|nr:U1 protein [Faba bean necrotic yellows virus]AHC72260.1 U1 protein [Faba bean necrotic yellows virus]
MVVSPVRDSWLVDEASDELISSERKLIAVECHDDDSQVINVKVEDICKDMSDKVVLKLQFRLCYKYRKLLDITLLGCRMKVYTQLKNTSLNSLKSLLQKRMNNICNGNYAIGIRMFFVNINQLIKSCKWIVSTEDVYPICTLYHMRDTDVFNVIK